MPASAVTTGAAHPLLSRSIDMLRQVTQAVSEGAELEELCQRMERG